MSRTPWRRSVAVSLSGLLTVTLAVAVTAERRVDAADDPFAALPDPPPVRSVPGRDVAVRPKAANPVVAAAKRQPPEPSWPAVGQARVRPAAAGRTGADRAGDLPVWVGPAKSARPAAASSVSVEMLGREAAADAGVDGLMLRLRRDDGSSTVSPVRLTVDYSSFRHAYGGDWASRLRVVDLDTGRTLPTRNDLAADRVSATVPVSSTESTLAVQADEEGATGDYSATSLSPSGTWQVDTNSGSFAWSYDLRVPPSPGGLDPALSASYSSGATDGRTASTNNQPSWVGEGWSLWPGFIERSYKSCADDTASGSPKTGDQCWATRNATMSFGDVSTRLVYDDGVWRPEDDDGTRVEHLTGTANGDNNGEYWRVTTTDGTQYYFGRNRLPNWSSGKPTTKSAWTVPVFGNDAGEPCHASTFGASHCRQAYRWNLDYVVDTHGNSLSYFYATQTNGYGLNLGKHKATYTRGGTLLRVEYGTRRGQEYAGHAPARVLFASANRCRIGADCSKRTGVSWPDVPWDRACGGSSCPRQYSPTFWTTKRLSRVTTQVWSGSGYRNVDRWKLSHRFPDPGDGTSAALWLHSIRHTGLVGSGEKNIPAVVFGGTAKPNRVDSVRDDLPSLKKYRIDAINNEAGGVINVKYAPTNCTRNSLPTPGRNRRRCFPVRWVMDPEVEPRDDWFHKYVVDEISQDDRVGGGKTQVTNYDYRGGGAWHYVDNPLVPADERTWSEWRGYEKVLVRHGHPASDSGRPQSATLYQYFRGMDGDRAPGGGTKSVTVVDSTGKAVADADPLAGFLREEIVYNGPGGEVVSGAIHKPWKRGPTATQGPVKAFQVENVRTTERTALSTGGFRRTRVDTTYDHQGNPTRVNDLGDVSVSRDDQCTTTTYARNTDTWLLTLPSRERTVGVACGTDPTYPDDAISDVRTYYDGRALGAAPTDGDATKVEEVESYSGGAPSYVTTSRATYDRYGRVLDSYDALDRKTESRYRPATGLPTSKTVTNPLGHTTTTTLEPAWGQPVATVDANGRRTDLSYDPLGRLTRVWLPGRSKSAGQSPNKRYAYGVRTSGPSWVRTEKLVANGSYRRSYTLLDGFLRTRQIQSPSPQGGRLLTDTIYDTRGLVHIERQPYYNADSEPSTSLFSPAAKTVPIATLTKYDGAERPITSHHMVRNVEKWRTTTKYGGDHVTVIPPPGGTSTTEYTDARGQTVELRQYHDRAATGDYDATRYRYTKAGQLAEVTDPAGNTWRYDYDVRGRKTSATDPDSGRTTMTYDAAGQLLTTTDARGATVATVYDDLGRKIETHRGSATGPLLAEWTYDTLSKGSLTSSTRYVDGAPYTKTVLGYDAAGRPTGETVTIPEVEGAIAGDYTTRMTYQVDGSPASVKLPALGDAMRSETLVYDYNGLGMPTTMTGWAPYLSSTEYTAYGEPSQVTLGSYPRRVQRSYWYEESTRRLSKVRSVRDVSLVADIMRYKYDPTGNVTSVVHAQSRKPTDRQCFAYDYLRRLTQAWTQAGDACAGSPTASDVGGPAPYWHSYDYDLTGNRTQRVRHGLGGAADSVTTYDYPDAGQLQPHTVRSTRTTGPGAGETSYTYDATGNTTRRPGPEGTQELTWSAEGRLDSIAVGDAKTSYVYDADGQQLIRRDPGSVTLFVGSGELRVDTATGEEHATRYYGTDGTTAVRTDAGLSWLVADHHGTAQIAIDPDTRQSVTRRYDPFGNPRGSAKPWPGGERGFVGGTENDVTGLTRLGAREYDPSIGRFISVDPIIDPNDPQQMNGYSYANNNPTTMQDPDGKKYFEGGGHRSYANQKAVENVKSRMPVRRGPTSTARHQDPGGSCPGYHRARCRQIADKREPLRLAAQHAGQWEPLRLAAKDAGYMPILLSPRVMKGCSSISCDISRMLEPVTEIPVIGPPFKALEQRYVDPFLKRYGPYIDAFGHAVGDIAETIWENVGIIGGVAALTCPFVGITCPVAVVGLGASVVKSGIACGTGGGASCFSLVLSLSTFGAGRILKAAVKRFAEPSKVLSRSLTALETEVNVGMLAIEIAMQFGDR